MRQVKKNTPWLIPLSIEEDMRIKLAYINLHTSTSIYKQAMTKGLLVKLRSKCIPLAKTTRTDRKFSSSSGSEADLHLEKNVITRRIQ